MDRGVFTRPASKEITEEELAMMSALIVLTPDVLARQLNIPTAVWSCIRQDHRDSTRAMVFEVLLKWLEGNPSPTPTFGDLHKLMSTGFELSDSEYDQDNDTVTFKRSPEKRRPSQTEEDVGHIQRKVSDLTITEYLPVKKKRGSPEKEQFYPVSGVDENEVHIIVKRGTDDHHHYSEENSPTKRTKKDQTKIEIYLSPRRRKPLAQTN